MQKQRTTLYLLLLLAGMGLASYAYLGNFTRMLADDFCSLYFSERLGLMRSIWYWYLNWSGRYTAFAMDWLILKSLLGPYNLHYIVPVSLLAWLACGAAAIYLALRKMGELAFLRSLALAGIFLVTVLNLSPNVPQSLFWWNGMRSYALPLVVLSAYMPIYQFALANHKVRLIWKCGLFFLLFLLSGGMGETVAVAQLVFILFLICLHIFKFLEHTGHELPILYSSLTGAVCSIIVVILAPGNAIRQTYLPPAPDVITLASISLQAYTAFIGDILREPAKVTGLLGAALATLWIGGQYGSGSSIRTKLVLAYILGGLAISFACFPPGVYGYSEPPPTRTMIIPLFFLVGGMLCAVFLAGRILAERDGTTWLRSNLPVVLSLLTLGFSVTVTALGLYNARQPYIEFAEKWDVVDAQIRQAQTAQLESVTIPAMDNWAGLERPNDNAKYWPTVCYSVYYDIQVFGPPYP